MKKIVSIFAAALLAAGFMGCSNDSDDNSALLLALSSDTYNSAYTLLQESTCSYSYNATTKRLYYRKTGYNSYVVRGDKKTALFDSSYSTDAQFVELFKKNDRIIYDNAGDNLDLL